MTYTLTDCIKQNARYPDTFAIPDPHQIDAIREGDHVKLIFEAFDPETGLGAERMWVTITTAEDGRYAGTLASMPFYLPLEYGDLVEFTSDNIASVMHAEGDAMIVEFSRLRD